MVKGKCKRGHKNRDTGVRVWEWEPVRGYRRGCGSAGKIINVDIILTLGVWLVGCVQGDVSVGVGVA